MRSLVCPNRKWIAVSLLFALVFITTNVLGALTIMWDENVAISYDHGIPKYPAWPVSTGLTEMTLRGNCKWIRVEGSGEVNKVGFAIYQLCADVFVWPKNSSLRKNEVRALTTNEGERAVYWKLVFSFETLTQGGINEDWKVSKENHNRLADARAVRDYLEDCDAECEGLLRDKGIENAIIQQALREVGMVERTVEHYNEAEEFKIGDWLKDNRTRLRREAWITMLGVTIVAMLWTLVGLVNTEEETDFAIVTRMLRESEEYGPTTIATVLEPGPESKSSYVVTEEVVGKNGTIAEKLSAETQSSSMDGNMRENHRTFDFVADGDHEENGVGVLLRACKYVYGKETEERAKNETIIIGYRSEKESRSNVQLIGPL